MADPRPFRSPSSSYEKRLAVSTDARSVANEPYFRSFRVSPSAIVSPKSPIRQASRNTVPLTRPSVMGRGRPCLTTSICVSRSGGRPSARAKLLKVPSERMPTGCLVSASFLTTNSTLPSPPATTMRARGVISFSKSTLGSNGMTRWSANSPRSLASSSGVMFPAPVLRMSKRLAVRSVDFSARAPAAVFTPIWWKSPALAGQAPPPGQRIGFDAYLIGTHMLHAWLSGATSKD